MKTKLIAFMSRVYWESYRGYASMISYASSALYLNKPRTFSSDGDNSNNFKPTVIYINADVKKTHIVEENRNKAGVYR